MIENKKILAVIPARGGSKGIPNKNIKKVAGKPLIAWTIEAAKQSGFLDRIILSSENDSIIEPCFPITITLYCSSRLPR
jgi:N-acylneuraminate cytidylyltransferase